MRYFGVAFLLLLVATVQAQAGGYDFELASATVHQVQTDATKTVFTVSGPCALFLQAHDREDKADRVDTALKRCVITVTKEAFERSGEQTVSTWAEYQKAAKALRGKAAFMQLGGIATLTHSRITAIQVSGMCYFKQGP